MKTSRVILFILIGIIGGYFIRMVVHPRDKGDANPKNITEIPRAEAQALINNYVGKQYSAEKPYYYKVSDEMLANINWLRANYNSDGSVIYFGSSTPNSEDADVAILARTDGSGVEDKFFKVDIKGINVCPPMCDVPLPERPVPVTIEEEETIDETPQEKAEETEKAE